MTVSVTAETTFKSGHQTLTFSDLEVGDFVEVNGVWVDESSLDAKRVSIEAPDDGEGESED